MSSLIVSLPAETASSATEWAYALTPDGRTLADHGKAPAALLPQPRGAGAEVVAVVPVQALAWHRVDLPKGVAPATPRLRTALEGLLEEQLLDEAEDLHLAVAPGARAGEPAWVAVCHRAWLRNALQLLEAAGRPASRVVPEFAPEGTATIAVLGDPEQPQVVVSSEKGVLALPLSTAALPLLPVLPEDAPRYAEPAVAAVAEQVLQHKMELQQAPQRWIQSAATRWDLAQFDFASTPRARALKKLATGWGDVLHGPPWRPARWAAIALVAINVLGLNAWAWKERAGIEAKRDEVRRTLTDTFPQVKVVVDAPVQMERELAQLRQAAGSVSARDLEPLLAAAGAALPDGRLPSSIEYTPGELRLRGVTLAPDEESVVSGRLQAAGYRARVDDGSLLLRTEVSP